MEKVVSRGIKIDLHIHSEYSKAKDGKKVEENTLASNPCTNTGILSNVFSSTFLPSLALEYSE